MDNTQPALQPISSAAIPYVQQATNYTNDPALQTAQNNVSDLTLQTGQSQAAEQTLPDLLAKALTPQIENANDADFKKSQTDLGNLLTSLGNPQQASVDAASEFPGAVLSPQQIMQINASKIGAEGAQLTSDNLILGARSGGIANVIRAAADKQASNTQNLLAKLQAAQSARDFLWQKATTQGGYAMSLAQLAQQQDQFEASQSQERLLNPLNQAQKSHLAMEAAAPDLTFDEFMAQFGNDPALAGMDYSAKYNQYKDSGGKEEISNQDLVKYGIKTGNLGQQWGAYLQQAANPATIVGGVATGAGTLGTLALQLGLLKGGTGILNSVKSGAGAGASWLGNLLKQRMARLESVSPEGEPMSGEMPFVE